MGFIENNLLDDEHIVHKAQIHWIIFANAFIWLLVGFAAYYYGTKIIGIQDDSIKYMSGAFVILSLYNFIKAYIHKYVTELVITDRRMMAKFGLIRRGTIEIPLLKIESVIIDQAIMERITGSGSVAVRGTGSAMAPVRFIDEPVEFRNKLNQAIANARAKYGKNND